MASKAPDTATRKKLDSKGQTMPGGRYPIPNVDFLKRAIRSIGRTPPGKRPAVVAWIKKRAAALGRSDLVQNLSNPEIMTMAGNPTSVGGVITTKKQAAPAAKNNKQVQSQVKGGGLKTQAGKVCYAQLRAKGYDKALAMAAAKKHEQGLVADELSNIHEDAMSTERIHVGDITVPMYVDITDLATPAVAAGDGPRVTAMGGAAGKLGLKSPTAVKVYAKLRKKNMPHVHALNAAKRVDRGVDAGAKKNVKLASPPKAR